MTPMDLDLSHQPVSADVIAAQADMGAAITLAIQVSGKQDKAVALDLDIDAGQWSRIKGGTAHFPHNKLNALCDALGNEVPLLWWAGSRGYELKRRLSAVEAENEKLRAELLDQKKREAVLMEALKR